jgi:hypothetical protein
MSAFDAVLLSRPAGQQYLHDGILRRVIAVRQTPQSETPQRERAHARVALKPKCKPRGRPFQKGNEWRFVQPGIRARDMEKQGLDGA